MNAVDIFMVVEVQPDNRLRIKSNESCNLSYMEILHIS